MSFQNSLPINHSLSGVTFEQKENWKESDNRKKENKKKNWASLQVKKYLK